MLLAQISDVVYQAIIAGCVTIVLAWMSQRAKNSADAAATKAEVVSTKLETSDSVIQQKLDHNQEITDKTHALVNSGDLIQKRMYADVMGRLAKLTKDPKDEEAAHEAEKLYQEHSDKQQAIVNLATAPLPPATPLKG